MIRFFANPLRRFRRSEDGSVIMIEFCIVVPIVIMALLMAIELSMFSMRQMFLERGLDMTVRHVRLSTNLPITHNQLKDMICEKTFMVPDCATTLRLEMRPTSIRNFASFDQSADCVDVSEDATPVRDFVLGTDHELMILRACVKFAPYFPTSALGKAMEKDGAGKARMVAVSSFVQEPS